MKSLEVETKRQYVAGSQKYSDEMTFKKVGPENIQTF